MIRKNHEDFLQMKKKRKYHMPYWIQLNCLQPSKRGDDLQIWQFYGKSLPRHEYIEHADKNVHYKT